MKTIQVLESIQQALLRLNINSSVEYPGYLEVRENDGRTFHFGFANGAFGWSDEDGGLGGESTLTEDSPVQELVKYVDEVLNHLTFRVGSKFTYNDGRPGHTGVKATVLKVYGLGMTVQFEDRADTTRILFSDRQWMDYIRVSPNN